MDVNVARRRLEAEWERLLEAQSAAELMRLSDAGEEESSGELSPIDQHQADLGSDVFEREMEYSIRDQIESDLQALFDAFRRVDLGTYGRCETCGEPIPEERLVATPATRFCIEHERLWELHALTMPFPDGVFFDGARSAEDVAEREAIEHLEFLPDDDELDERDELAAEEAALHRIDSGGRADLEAADVEMAEASEWEEQTMESAASDLEERELRRQVRDATHEGAELGD